MPSVPFRRCHDGGVIVVAGEALIDLVVGSGGVVATPGGAPYNVARGCARLGAPVTLLACVSDDMFGRHLEFGLVDAGVDVALLQRTDRPTTLAVAELNSEGVAGYTFYVEGTSALLLAVDHLPDGARTLVTGGLALLLEPMAGAVEKLVMSAPSEVLVVLDVNSRPAVVQDRPGYVGRVGRVATRADVVKVSDEDLAYLWPGRAVEDSARELLAGGPLVVIVTAGGQATTIVSAAGGQRVPVEPAAIVDTVGAGDAFTAGFVAWWCERGNGRPQLDRPDELDLAVRAGHAVAAVVVTRQGADPPARSELSPPWTS